MSFKTLLRFPVQAPKAIEHVGGARADGREPIELDLRTEALITDGARHLATLGVVTARKRLSLRLRCNRRILSAIGRKEFGPMFLSMPHVHWDARSRGLVERPSPIASWPGFARRPGSNSTLPPRDGSRATRHAALTFNDHGEGDGWHLRLGRDIEPAMLVMPYPMHPIGDAMTPPTDRVRLRSQPRQVRILFAGRQKASYGKNRVSSRFGVLSRLDFLDTLRNAFPNRIGEHVGMADEKPIILQDAGRHPIAANQWLRTLASADFFLCPPGVCQPLCHHLVEAISVGTVPILEYGPRVSPYLVDGENAILFRGSGGLIAAISRVNSMSSREIATMRAGAIEFFERHYDVHRWFDQLVRGSHDLRPRRICMPFHSHNLYRDPQHRRMSRAA